MRTQIQIEINTDTLKELVVGYLREKMGQIDFEAGDIEFLVMSKQNYRVKEWEQGEFKAKINKWID